MPRPKAALGRLAAEIRADFGLAPSDAFDPHAWSEANGIPFISIAEFESTEAASRRFLVEKPEVWSAALLKDGRAHLVIYNPAHTTERIRSNLTHEVAHFEAEHPLSGGWLGDDGSCGGSSKPHEKEAAELAGALLVPAEVARVQAIRGGSAADLAARYRVSEPMAEWRMRESGGYVIAQRFQAKRHRGR
jgi:hypothetical protein